MYDNVCLRLNLKGEEARKFKAVKEWLGLRRNTEVVRALVSEAYRNLKKSVEREPDG